MSIKILKKIYPSLGGVDYNLLLFKIKNINLPIKKFYPSLDKVKNN